jgi:predicted Fe-S protein YdhL (DUF1289 family)
VADLLPWGPARAKSAGMASEPPAPAAIATPCIKVCIVDGESGLCMGCLRSLPEVARWGAMTNAERSQIMAGLSGRRARVRPEKLALFHPG